jgi:hypothetical protein
MNCKPSMNLKYIDVAWPQGEQNEDVTMLILHNAYLLVLEPSHFHAYRQTRSNLTCRQDCPPETDTETFREAHLATDRPMVE